MARIPRYREIETYLRELVAKSEVGDLLPTVAELCERFDVNGVQTIRNAYEPLIDEGLVAVHMRPRRRWYVANTSPTEVDPGAVDDLAVLEDTLRSALEQVVTLGSTMNKYEARFRVLMALIQQGPCTTAEVENTIRFGDGTVLDALPVLRAMEDQCVELDLETYKWFIPGQASV